MTWQNEMVRIVRHLISDLSISSPTYTDDRLEETVLVSAQLVLHEIDFENIYTIDVDSVSLSPDPTSAGNKDDAFINIISLKTACLVLGSEFKTYTLSSIRISDGPSTIDTQGVAKGLESIYKDMCERYENAKIQYKAGNSIAGGAILGPYSPGADVVRGGGLENRGEIF